MPHNMFFSRLTHLLGIFALLTALAASTCYNPNGLARGSSNYLPCNSVEGATSMCCALNRTTASGGPSTGPPTADLCLSNGICENVLTDVSTGAKIYNYWRESCTDANWGPGCLENVCTAGTEGSSDYQVTPCDTTTDTTHWCCGQNNAECCSAWPNHSLAVTLALTLSATTGAATTPSTASSKPSLSSANTALTSTSASFTRASGAPSSTQSTNPSSSSLSSSALSSSAHPAAASSSSLTTAAKAGIGIAVAGGILILAAAGAFFFARSRDTKRTRQTQAAKQLYAEAPVPPYGTIYPSELWDTREFRSELPTKDPTAFNELPVSGGGVGGGRGPRR